MAKFRRQDLVRRVCVHTVSANVVPSQSAQG